MKRIQHLILLATFGLLSACGSHDEAESHETNPVAVSVRSAGQAGPEQSISVSGRIEAGNSANLSTRMMGSVTQVLVRPGEEVRKGQLLLTLSSADLSAKQAQVKASTIQAESNFKNARKDYERFQELYRKGSASEKELENITTRFEAAEAGLQAAKEMEKEVNAQFAYSNLRAPFSGVVANTFVKVGDIARPGMPLVAVEGTSGYEATVMVPETHIPKIKLGAEASVLIKSSNQTLRGEVIEVSPSARNTGGQYLVKIGLNETEDILPGMFVNARIDVPGDDPATSSAVVDREAIVRNGQLSGVYVLSDRNTAILRWLRLGQEFGDQVEVLSGLKSGERYIVRAEGKLFNGAPVKIQ